MENDLTKKQRAELRKLNDAAWTRELKAALAELEKEFSRWRKGELDPFDLNELIHKFHDGTSRGLYKKYAYNSDFYSAYRAIAGGIISEEEMSDELREAISERIRNLRGG